MLAATLTEKIMISFSANFANDQVPFGAFVIAAVGNFSIARRRNNR